MNALTVDGLTVSIKHRGQLGVVLDHLDLDVRGGKILALVGESGAGKSMLAKTLIRLLPPTARITSGSVRFDGIDLAHASDAQLAGIRGRRIAIVFQNPRESLNPTFTVRDQLGTVLRVVGGHSAKDARAASSDLLTRFGLADPERVLASYPHQMSGGMAQRVLIALALAADPELILADEPATGLDIATQTQLVLELTRFIRDVSKTAIVISHDIGLVAGMADDIAVVYAGKVVEQGPIQTVLEHPRHPYTNGLLAAAGLIPSQQRLSYIGGSPPSPFDRGPGCPYAPRCPHAFEDCRHISPRAIDSGGATVRCHLYEPTA